MTRRPVAATKTFTGASPSAARARAGLGPRLALAAALATALLAVPRSALAWGRLGHRAAAKLTEARLTPAARAAVRDLLEPGESLADASVWADSVRRDRPESGPWHYVNVPITEPAYNDRFCGEKGCVVRKIEDFRQQLADKNAPRADRREALRFLVHFVQDMHQPVHVGDRGDRGGNDLQVQFFGNGSNLHRVWDSGLLEQVYKDEAALVRDLEQLVPVQDAGEWSRGTVASWANESLDAARGAYRDPVTGQELPKKGVKLAAGYQATHLPVACGRLARAGVRLATVLNEALDGR